jgi:flagellar biosynthesis anti-sigma factor FlgM
MKIEHRNSGNLPRLPGASGGSSAGPISGHTQASPPGWADQVEISTASGYLTAVQSSGQVMSAYFAAKVSALSDAVSAGAYQVDAWAVSDGMVREHLRAA